MRRAITKSDAVRLAIEAAEHERQRRVVRAPVPGGVTAEASTAFGFGDGTATPGSPGTPVVVQQLSLLNDADNYLTKFAKLIPIEVVTAFVTVDTLIRSQSASETRLPGWGYVAVCVALWIFAPLYAIRSSRVKGLPPAYRQAIIAGVVFPIWVYAIGGPFGYINPEHNPFVAAVLLPLVALAAPFIVDPPKS